MKHDISIWAARAARWLLILILTFAVTLVALLPGAARADEDDEEEVFDPIAYDLDDNRAGDFWYTIEPNGALVTGYSGRSRQVEIPKTLGGEPVVGIGKRAFAYVWWIDEDPIDSIFMPDSVTSIGEGAFSECSFQSIDIPNNVTHIGKGAFYGCTELTSVRLSDKVTSIGDYAFNSCSSLTEIIVDAENPEYSTVNGILYDKDKSTLIRCPGGTLGSVDILNSVTSIKEGFNGCAAVTEIRIPEGISNIEAGAFNDCTSLMTIRIPDGVVNLGECMFNRCKSLTSVTIGIGVTNIGEMAFSDCESLKSIRIPDNVTTISDDAFKGCYNLTISCNAGSVAEAYAKEHEISVHVEKTETEAGFSYRIEPEGAVVTGYSGSSSQVEIPQKLGGEAVVKIGAYAFADRRKEHAPIDSVTIPNSVAIIEGSAFAGCDLRSIDISGSVTYIGAEAFWDCTNLTQIHLTKSVTGLGYGVFSGCKNLDTISVDIENPMYSSKDGLLYNKQQTEIILCPEGRQGQVDIPDSVTNIGNWAFAGCVKLSAVNIADSVTRIGVRAFYLCNKLTSIHIPDSVTSIGAYAFCYCFRLTSIIVSKSVTKLEPGVFCLCTSLPSITIPDSVTSIGTGVFNDCPALVSINIPDSVTRFGDFVFGANKDLTIYGSAGSAAETYAKSEGISFQILPN